MPYKFSPSSLSLLADCPRCFWLKFNKKFKRPASIFPSLPSGMDKVLKIHFDSFRKKGVLPPEIAHLKGVKMFDDLDLLNIWRNNFRGIQFTDKEGNLFRGAVDEILQLGDKLIVLDYKTRGYPLKDNTAGYYQNQLDIYNLLLRLNRYKTEDYSYLLFFHPTSYPKFQADLVKIPVNIENAKQIFRSAKALLKGTIPPPSDNCEFCKYAKGWADY